MRLFPTAGQIALIAAVLAGCAACGLASEAPASSRLEKACLRAGWHRAELQAAGLPRRVMWQAPSKAWTNGAILVLHGGGGQADHFCAGGALVQPQIEFATMALERGFAVFALDATTDKVTDSKGRPCGKRFDFSVVERANIDLPYISMVVTELVAANRPAGSNQAVFLTGLSTGGYMTIRAAAELPDKFTAFAPISAGDPFGTDTICDESLSERKSAKGILVDRETGKEIVTDNACASTSIARENPWPASKGRKPPYKQFQNASDGIVDISCMRKATAMLDRNGFPGSEPFLITADGKRDPFKHLWLRRYNQPLLDFLAAQAAAGGL